jgi:hypothetical protein
MGLFLNLVEKNARRRCSRIRKVYTHKNIAPGLTKQKRKYGLKFPININASKVHGNHIHIEFARAANDYLYRIKNKCVKRKNNQNQQQQSLSLVSSGIESESESEKEIIDGETTPISDELLALEDANLGENWGEYLSGSSTQFWKSLDQGLNSSDGQLRPGTTVEVMEFRSVDSVEFARIKLQSNSSQNKRYTWVKLQNIKRKSPIIGAIDASRQENPAESIKRACMTYLASSAAKNMALVMVDHLNVRDPNNRNKIVGTLALASVVAIDSLNTKNRWTQIKQINRSSSYPVQGVVSTRLLSPLNDETCAITQEDINYFNPEN